jgi:hypothetical protein
MRVNRLVKLMAVGLAGAAVAVAAVSGAQAVGVQPGAGGVIVAAGYQGSPGAVPPMLAPLRASGLAAMRRAEARQWRALSYRLPAGARYSTAEMSVFAAAGYVRS